ncbi:MAG: adenosylhomocysteinase [Eubacteriales bacterium]|nr:adenosylhomocysteinase [Eubacteriales bacterium]
MAEEKQYDIRDINLADSGRIKIDWVRANMPVLSAIEKEFAEKKPFEGIKISLSVHLEAKTAYLCETLAAGGAVMSVTGSNVLSTQDDVAAALAAEGLRVFAVHGESEEEYSRHIKMTLANGPQIIIDDGGDLVNMLHTEMTDLADGVYGGCEETTTGVIRLHAMDKDGVLRFPMVAVNDARCKHLFDNRYGTGQSVWESIMHNTNLIVASKTVVVAGYGWCGKGVAMRASAMGARVIVTEVDPVKAIEARMDGYDVMPMADAASYGDFFVTVTGCDRVITEEHFSKMKNGAVLANAGHFDVEIDMDWLNKNCAEKKEARENITGYILKDGKQINVLAEGRLVNIAASNGHPAEIMDMSFAVQALSALYILQNHGNLENHVINVTDRIDDMVARRRLEAWGTKIDTLTEEQENYLNSWQL